MAKHAAPGKHAASAQTAGRAGASQSATPQHSQSADQHSQSAGHRPAARITAVPEGQGRPGAAARSSASSEGQGRLGAAARSGARPEGQGRLGTWAANHPRLGMLALGLVCFAGLAAVFYFVVFSDFGSSADFIYSQF